MYNALQLIPTSLLLRLFFFALFFTFTSCAHSTNASKKNVLFIIVDDLRPALGCYDDILAITPNIDRLAEKCTLFRRAYAQQALCAPSRNSMLTSRRPDALHLYDWNSYWRKTVGNFTTLPQYFKENGYETFSIGKVFHPGISSNHNDDFPLSWSNETFHPSTEQYMNAAVCFDKHTHTMPHRNLVCPVHVKSQPDRTLPDIQSVAEAKRLLNTFNSMDTKIVKPFFIAIGFHKPHIPFMFPKKYLRYHSIDKFQKNDFTYVPYKLPTVAFNPYNDIRRRDDVQNMNISFPFGPMERHLAWHIRQAYYACVTFVDELVGDLLNYVDFSNTIIVLTSDHGYSLGEHAEWAKYTNYEIGVRVPLIIYAPQQHSIEKATQINDPVELVDIFPTLVDLAALPKIKACRKSHFKQSTCTQGKSLIPYITGNRQQLSNLNMSSHFAISQYPRPSVFPSQYPDSDRPLRRDIKIMGYSLRFSHFRYTIWLEFNAITFKRNWHRYYGEELYDHSIDPDEYLNLFDRVEFTAIKSQLKRILRSKLDH